MTKIDPTLQYTKSHEWVRFIDGEADDGSEDILELGITDHAQDQLGDVVFLELPEIGAEFSKGQAFGVVESTKAVSDIYMPYSGTIVEVNEALADSPELINTDCYGKGWCIRFKPSAFDDEVGGDNILAGAAYQVHLDAED